MEDVEHNGIDKHNNRLEKPKKPLLLQQRAKILGVRNVEASSFEILDCSEDGANGNQATADEKNVQYTLDLVVDDAGSPALIVKA